MDEVQLTDVVTFYHIEYHNVVIIVVQSPTGKVKKIDTTYSTDYIN